MIQDVGALQSVQDGWHTVRRHQAMVETILAWPLSIPVAAAPDFRALPYTLLMIVAFTVLEEALVTLESEGRFSSKDRRLGPLMTSSRAALPWRDFSYVDGARRDRNDAAHRQRLLDPAVCTAHIDALETELLAWRILPERIRYTYTITVG